MWLSEKLSEKNAVPVAEKGNVTLSAANLLEADASVRSRSVQAVTPYGYRAKLPPGLPVALLPAGDGELALCLDSPDADLQPGEIKITSLGGAKIVLKNNGTVVINDRYVFEQNEEVIPD